MNKISLEQAIEFQEVFWHDGRYSPYESVVDQDTYFPAVIIGEVGTFLNSYFKQLRSPNNYAKEIENDCADIFICLLIYVLILQKRTKSALLGKVKSSWNTKPKSIKNDTSLLKECVTLMQNISKLPRKGMATQAYLSDLFESIKSISFYATKKEWQEVIDSFHIFTFDKITNFERYTPDLWYRGSCWVNFKKVLSWGIKSNADMSPKKMLFLKRIAALK